MKIKLKGCFEILGARRGSQGREIKKKKRKDYWCQIRAVLTTHDV
jgi:hypothetical protein